MSLEWRVGQGRFFFVAAAIRGKLLTLPDFNRAAIASLDHCPVVSTIQSRRKHFNHSQNFCRRRDDWLFRAFT